MLSKIEIQDLFWETAIRIKIFFFPFSSSPSLSVEPWPAPVGGGSVAGTDAAAKETDWGKQQEVSKFEKKKLFQYCILFKNDKEDSLGLITPHEKKKKQKKNQMPDLKIFFFFKSGRRVC